MPCRLAWAIKDLQPTLQLISLIISDGFPMFIQSARLSNIFSLGLPLPLFPSNFPVVTNNNIGFELLPKKKSRAALPYSNKEKRLKGLLEEISTKPGSVWDAEYQRGLHLLQDFSSPFFSRGYQQVQCGASIAVEFINLCASTNQSRCQSGGLLSDRCVCVCWLLFLFLGSSG